MHHYIQPRVQTCQAKGKCYHPLIKKDLKISFSNKRREIASVHIVLFQTQANYVNTLTVIQIDKSEISQFRNELKALFPNAFAKTTQSITTTLIFYKKNSQKKISLSYL